MQFRVASILLLAAAIADARVCDEASSLHVPCFPLAGDRKMPQIAMGTWGGSYKDCAYSDFTCINQEARFATESWLHLNGTHIDAANDYRSQTAVAAALKNTPGYKREEIFLETKCPGAIGYEATIQCADDALQMLGQFTEQGFGYIDLLLIHYPFIRKPMCRFNSSSPECKPISQTVATKAQLQDTWRAMEELKRIGVAKSIGISDYNTTQIAQTLETAKQPIEVLQTHWNPLEHDEDLWAFCKQHGIQMQAFGPLGGAKGSGSLLKNPLITKIAAKHNVSTAQVTLRWSLQRDVALVVGTANPEHAASDLDLFHFVLTDDEVASISKLQKTTSSVITVV